MAKGFHPAIALAAMASALGAARVEVGPEPSAHDHFHHPRSRMTSGWKHRARLKQNRRSRNAMAKQSRRRNRGN